MEVFTAFPRLVPLLAIALMVLIMPVYGQMSSPCTASMLFSFTPCMNFITNSTTNGTSPTPACCNALKSITSNGTGCLCLIASGSVPFQIPINRTLAISLPRACNMPGVPLLCKAPGAPIPAPGPVVPTISPRAAPSAPSPKASTVPEPVSPSLAPEADTSPDLIPASPTEESEAPTTDSGIRPVLTPSAAAKPSLSFSPSLLLAVLGVIVLKYY